MEKEYNNQTYAPQLSSINTADPKYEQPLLNFYVASSYNSCCAGDFQDSYVSLEPLEQIIFHGARVLDFEVYCPVLQNFFYNHYLYCQFL